MCFSVTAVTFFNCSPSLNSLRCAVHKNPIKTKRQNYKAHARNSQALLSAACTMNIQTGKQRTVSAQTCICLLSPHSFTADVSGPTACLRRRFFLDVRKARLRLRRLRELARACCLDAPVSQSCRADSCCYLFLYPEQLAGICSLSEAPLTRCFQRRLAAEMSNLRPTQRRQQRSDAAGTTAVKSRLDHEGGPR